MIYPNKLKKNDTIEIISPSNGVKSKKIRTYENAIQNIEDHGFKVIEDKYVRNSINGVSSSAQNRAIEFNNAIINKSTKALIACSGGDYLIQVLDLINLKKVRANPKWIQGQSDITPLLFYVTTKYDIATIYSFNAKTFGEKNTPKDMINNNIKFLLNEKPTQFEYGFMNDNDAQIIKPWKCLTKNRNIKGRIIGGCLDSLKDIIGTKYDNVKNFIKKYKEDGIVWFFDIANMSNEDILRTMWQFKSAGWLNNCTGVIFGRLFEEKTYTDLTLEEAIMYYLRDINVPVLINADIGHTDPVLTIINGSKVKISYDTNNNKYKIETFFNK